MNTNLRPKDVYADVVGILSGTATEIKGLSRRLCHESVVLGVVVCLDTTPMSDQTCAKCLAPTTLISMTSSAVFPNTARPASLNPCNQSWPDQSDTAMDMTYLAEQVGNCAHPSSTEDIPIFRTLKRLVTLFAPPTVTDVGDFLVAVLGRTRRVCNTFILDVHYRSPSREELRLVRHAEL